VTIQIGEKRGQGGATDTKSDRVPMVPPHSAHTSSPSHEYDCLDPLVPFARDESESKEFGLVLFSIRLVPFLIP
jgi:hypothetical protein